MFSISHSKTKYDIVASKNIEILFINSDQENDYREYYEEIDEKHVCRRQEIYKNVTM